MNKEPKKALYFLCRLTGAIVFIAGGLLQDYRVVGIAYMVLLVSWYILDSLAGGDE